MNQITLEKYEIDNAPINMPIEYFIKLKIKEAGGPVEGLTKLEFKLGWVITETFNPDNCSYTYKWEPSK